MSAEIEKAKRRKTQFKRRLGDLSGIIRTQLEQNPDSVAIGIVFKKDAWQMIRMAIEYSRRSGV